MRASIKDKAVVFHGRTPGLRELPLPLVIIIVGLVFINAAVWVAIGIVLVYSIHSVAMVVFPL